MGIMNHDCIIATTWDSASLEFLLCLAEKQGIESLTVSPANDFGYQTVMLPPDGGKEGWEASGTGDRVRELFISLIESFNYGDGSNPFSWVEVSFGEHGQQVKQGNNDRVYG